MFSATEMVSGCYSVRPSDLFTCIVATFSGRIYMKYNIGDLGENLLKNSKFSENQARILGTLYVFLLPALSLTEMVSS